MADAWLVRLPAPPLRPYVDSYAGYRQAASAGSLHRGLPSRHLTCIVSVGDPIDVAAQTDPRQPPARYRFALSGLQARPALIRRSTVEEGVAIELTPLGARALLGVPASALWDTTVEASDVMGAAAVELWERLQVAAGWEERFTACDEALIRVVGRSVGVRRELAAAWKALVARGGQAAVAEVAADVGWSRQHLGARFAREFGLSPKLASRVVRFERARVLLAARPTSTVADVAAACGYYDQAHLDLDFARFAGCPPTQWRREELPYFQDAATGASAHSAA